MTTKDLGRLQHVELRDIWLSEASDFTPWLARKENLEILRETLGIDLELEAKERSVGRSVRTSCARTLAPTVGF